MSAKSDKVIGGIALLAAVGLGVWYWKSGAFGMVTATNLNGRIAQRREREKDRARAFLSRVTGQQATDSYADDVVSRVSGMASGHAQGFQTVLYRNAIEGRVTGATYGDLGVAE